MVPREGDEPMLISSMPEWMLSPVRLIAPGRVEPFPALATPERVPQTVPEWLERHASELEALLLEHAGVLLRGFDVPDDVAFERASQSLCRALTPRYGDLVKRPSSDVVYDATWYPKDRAILFHNEGSHTPELPTRRIFYCGRDGFTGGETPIVDCRRLYRAIPPRILEPLEKKGLLYVRNFIRGVDVSWQDFFRTDDRAAVDARCRAQGIESQWHDDGTLRILTRAPAVVVHPVTCEKSFCNQIMLHHVACLDARTLAAMRAVYEPEEMPRSVAYGDGTPIDDETVAELLRVTVRTAVRFTWRRGDVLVLDNLTAAHARSPFDGDRQILVAVGDVITQRALARTSPQASLQDAAP